MLSRDLCCSPNSSLAVSSSLMIAASSIYSCPAGKGGLRLQTEGCQLRLLHLGIPVSISAKPIGATVPAEAGGGKTGNGSNSRCMSLAADGLGCIRVVNLGGDVFRTWAQLESAVVNAESENAEEVDNSASKASSSKCVLVVGATGGVGQLVTAALLDRGIQVRALLRDAEKGLAFFGDYEGEKFQLCIGDTRQPDSLDQSLLEGVTHVICCTGTTAFPSKRWFGDNTPEQTDWHGVRNLIAAVPSTVQKFVLVSSVGVTRYDQLPWSIMNLFGVLKFKKMGEDFLRASGIPYTIIRPGRLTDGPYTSYDLNTLLKATAGNRRAIILDQGDKLSGEASRIVVAEACIQALDLVCTNGQTYEINSIEGPGPGKDEKTWESLFKKAHSS